MRSVLAKVVRGGIDDWLSSASATGVVHEEKVPESLAKLEAVTERYDV